MFAAFLSQGAPKRKKTIGEAAHVEQPTTGCVDDVYAGVSTDNAVIADEPKKKKVDPSKLVLSAKRQNTQFDVFSR